MFQEKKNFLYLFELTTNLNKLYKTQYLVVNFQIPLISLITKTYDFLF